MKREGQQVPQVIFRTRSGGDWKNVSSNDLFKGKTVVLFSLPGAFTPTCSSTHLPRYNELAPAFFANGVDSIVCVSVNDAFVMNEWAAGQECDNVQMLPDGNGEFSGAMGMLVDKSDLGFGKRSWRYSMLVRDGVIEKMFIEPQKAGDPFDPVGAAKLRQLRLRKPERDVEVARTRVAETLGEDADHLVGLAVERDRIKDRRLANARPAATHLCHVRSNELLKLIAHCVRGDPQCSGDFVDCFWSVPQLGEDFS